MEGKPEEIGKQINDAQELDKNLSGLMELLSVVPDIIYRIDADGKILYISNSVENLGYKPSDLIGKHFSVLLHPEDVKNASRSEVLPRYAGKVTGGDKSPKLFDERRSGNRATKNLIVRLIPKEGAAPAAGGNQTAPVKKTIYAELLVSQGIYKNARKSVGEEAREAGADDSALSEEPNKSFRYAEVAAQGHYRQRSDSARQFEGTVGVIRDITERQNIEEQNLILEGRFLHSQKMEAIGLLAGGIAHDFNNILGAVSGYADMIVKRFGSTDLRLEKYANGIIGAVRRASDMTSKLLAFARLGKYQLVEVNLHQTILDSVLLLQHSIDKRIEIHLNLNARNYFVLGDPGQIQNVLLNISLNARDALPNGGEIVFSTENEVITGEFIDRHGCHIPAGDAIVLSISDNGIGMDENVKAHIFEPFFTTKERGKGTGLGLASSYGIIEAHKGVIDVQSELGKGTTFEIFLPACQDAAQRSLQNDKAQSRKNAESPRKRVLLIDDEEMVLDSYKDMLEELGFAVETCKNGEEAIRYFRINHHLIDLVVLDIIMPKLDGNDCFRELRKISPEVKVIIASGYSLNEDVQALIKDGALGFIQKPFVSDDLMRKIKEVMLIK